MKLKNRDEIIEQLTEQLMWFDKERIPLRMDVYLYIDEDGQGSLHIFDNPGGNSWLDDDHITLFRSSDLHVDPLMELGPHDEMINVLGEDYEKVVKEVAAYDECEEAEVTENDIIEYLHYCTDKYTDIINEYYNTYYIDEYRDLYEENAERIIEEVESWC